MRQVHDILPACPEKAFARQPGFKIVERPVDEKSSARKMCLTVISARFEIPYISEFN